MTVSARMSGTLEVAAALAFHLPGARLDLSSPDGSHCSVGPLTDPRSMLHPAEFREMIVATNSGRLIDSMLGRVLRADPTLSLTTMAPGVKDLGGGVYQVAGRDATTYTFATPLPAQEVDRLLSDLDADRVPGRLRHPSDLAHDDELIAVSLVQDDGLGVTLVVIHVPDAADSDLEASVAQTIAAACLVAEMERLSIEPGGPAG